MRQVWAARDLAEAHLVKGVLEAAGIGASVRGEQLTSGVGVRAPEAEMRSTVWVTDAELRRAHEVLEEYRDTTSPGEGLPPLGEEADVAARGVAAPNPLADEEAQRAMSELFVTADRLMRAPRHGVSLDEAAELAALIAHTAAPFGVDTPTWDRIGELAAVVAEGRTTDDDDHVREAARALRDCLRPLV